MSIRQMTRVWDQFTRYAGGDLLVLLALADWADDAGKCWPSVPAIARKVRLSERQVHYVLRGLTKDGAIFAVAGGGRGKRNVYQINPNFSGVCEANPAITSGFSDGEVLRLDTATVAPAESGNPAITSGFSEAETLQSATEKPCNSQPQNPAICDEKPCNLAQSPKTPIRRNRQEPSIYPSGDPWQKIIFDLENHVNRQSFETWLKPLRYAGAEDEGRTLVVEYPTEEFRNVGERYAGEISQAMGRRRLCFEAIRFRLARDGPGLAVLRQLHEDLKTARVG